MPRNSCPSNRQNELLRVSSRPGSRNGSHENENRQETDRFQTMQRRTCDKLGEGAQSAVDPEQAQHVEKNGRWRRTDTGALTSDPLDGTARATEESRASSKGTNEKALQVWVFSHKEDEEAGVVNGNQLRELARVVNATGGHMPKRGTEKEPRWFPRSTGKKTQSDALGLQNFANQRDGTFDPLEGYLAMGPRWAFDGATPSALVQHFKDAGMGVKEARMEASLVTAG